MVCTCGSHSKCVDFFYIQQCKEDRKRAKLKKKGSLGLVLSLKTNYVLGTIRST